MQTRRTMPVRQFLRQTDRRLFAVLVVTGAALIAGYWLVRHPLGSARGTAVPTQLQNSLWPEPRPLTSFVLRDQHGQRFDLDRLRGRWTFMFFGYASCPDVCPTTLTVLKHVAVELSEAPVQFVFVSVDVERDHPEQLGRYLRYFDPAFVGVTGEPRGIAALARQLNVMYERIEQSSGQYLIAHTSSVMLVDPQARLYAAFSDPLVADTIAHNFRMIQDLYEYEAQQ